MNPLIATAEKIDATKKKAKKVVKSWKFRLLAILIGLLGACLIMFLTFMRISAWYDQYKIVFKFPIEINFYPPVSIQKRESLKIKPSGVDILPTKKVIYTSEYEYAMSKPHGQILWNIFMLESNRGKNDQCRIQGLGYNGLGLGESEEYVAKYGPNCFESFEKLWDRAEKLIVDLGVDKAEGKAICRWKYGDKFDQPNCSYYQSYLTL